MIKQRYSQAKTNLKVQFIFWKLQICYTENQIKYIIENALICVAGNITTTLLLSQNMLLINQINLPPHNTPQQSPINQLAFPYYSSVSTIKSNQSLYRLHVCCPPTFPFFNLVSLRILPTVSVQLRYEELSGLMRSNLFDPYEEVEPDEKPICEPVFRERGDNQEPSARSRQTFIKGLYFRLS